MKDEIKIVNCGCSGKPMLYVSPITTRCLLQCESCKIETAFYDTEIEAVKAWNKAMGAEKNSIVSVFSSELIAKDINVPSKFATDTNIGNKTAKFKQNGEFLRCGKCNHIVDSGYKYCPNCGCRLEWK